MVHHGYIQPHLLFDLLPMHLNYPIEAYRLEVRLLCRRSGGKVNIGQRMRRLGTQLNAEHIHIIAISVKKFRQLVPEPFQLRRLYLLL